MATVHLPGESTEAKQHVQGVIDLAAAELGAEMHVVSSFLIEDDRLDVDMVVVAPHKLFVVVVPNVRGFVVAYKGDTVWEHGDGESTDGNPLGQAERAKASLEAFLRSRITGQCPDVDYLVALPKNINRYDKARDPALTDGDKERIREAAQVAEYVNTSYSNFLNDQSQPRQVLSQKGMGDLIELFSNQETLRNVSLEHRDVAPGSMHVGATESGAEAVQQAATMGVSSSSNSSGASLKVVALSIVAIVVVGIAGFLGFQYINNTTNPQVINQPIVTPPPPDPRFPEIAIESPTDNVVLNQMGVQFVPTVTDPDKQVRTYYWSFGDGSESNQITPFHRYEKPGTYVASLVVKGQGFDTITRSHTITISGEIDPIGCTPGAQLPALVQDDNPVIILTREEVGQEFAIKNGLFEALDQAGFVVVDPTVIDHIKDNPIIERIWKLDCDSMASLGAYLSSYILITVQHTLEQTSSDPIAFLATIQLVALNTTTGQEMFRGFEERVMRGVTVSQAERNALLEAARAAGKLMTEKLGEYY